VRSTYGPTTIHSGYRTRRYNATVGGAPNSYHVYLPSRRGVAADFSCQRGRPAAWAELLDDLHAPGLGRYGDHVHVDNRVGHARW
jgi:uncharacterized protein YcbK (DUF882 family)